MERQRDKYVLSPSQQRDAVCQIETPSKMLLHQPPPCGRESWHCPFYLSAPGTERSRRRESLGSWGWMAADVECQTLKGRVRGNRERAEGRYPGSVHVHKRRGA